MMGLRLGASDGYFWDNGAGSPISDEAFTLAAWMKIVSAADPSNNFMLGVTGGSFEQSRIDARRSGSTYSFRIFLQNDAFDTAIIESSAVNLDQWYHVCATFISHSSRELFVDGLSEGTNTQSRATKTHVGYAVGNSNSGFEAIVADVGVWSVQLSDEEIARLALGYSARLIDPANIAAYVPFVTGSEYIDPYGLSPAMTKVATPAGASDHPPILGVIAV